MASKVKAKKRAVKAPKALRRGRTSTSKLSSKNQVTVPVEILRQVGIGAGDSVEFAVNDAGFIEVHPMGVNNLVGHEGLFTDVFKGFDLAKERQSWNR